MKKGENKVLVVGPKIRQKVAGWKPRIYKKFKTIREFILYLGGHELFFNEKQFSAWLTGENKPPLSHFEAVEGKLKELGI